MCMLIRIFISIVFSLPLYCVAQCGSESIQSTWVKASEMVRACDQALSLSITTRKHWQFNVGVLETYRADAKLPLGMRAEKADNFRRWVEVTRILHIEKSF